MTIKTKATNMDMTPAIAAKLEEKFSGLTKYFDNIQSIDVEVGKTTRGQNKGDVFFCEINVAVPKTLLRYREVTDDLYKAITDCKNGIQQEIKKYKEKLSE